MPKSLATVLFVLLVTIAVPSKVAAQGSNPGNPSILQAIQAIQSSVDALASQLTSLANVVNALGTPPNVVATGFLFKPSGFSAGCNAVNAGTSGVTVKAELVRLNGEVQQSLDLVLGAGQGNGFSLAIGSLPATYWCRFTMVTGSSADIRANLDVVSETTGLTNMIREAR